MDYLAIGRVIRPHGVHGEMLVERLTDFPEQLPHRPTLYVGDSYEPHPLKKASLHGEHLLIQFADCPTRDAAEAFRRKLLFIPADQAAPLPPGKFYQHQVVGLRVVTDTGEELGEVVDLLETRANDVYIVQGPSGEILLPAIKSVILNIDPAQQVMTVHLLEGLR